MVGGEGKGGWERGGFLGGGVGLSIVGRLTGRAVKNVHVSRVFRDVIIKFYIRFDS